MHYCDACRLNQCPECRVLGGRRGPKCLYITRRRRPGLTTVYNVVSEEAIVDLYLAHRALAVRIAGSICGPMNAEDVVHNVVVFLLEKHDRLRDTLGAAYFLTAVLHGALRWLLYGWARHVVAMDSEALLVVEEMSYEPSAGGRASERDSRKRSTLRTTAAQAIRR